MSPEPTTIPGTATGRHELPGHASTIVIGGGVMGCSTLYHLARLGVGDAILLERNELTSGTTWHSAAQVRALRSTHNLTRLIQYSARLYAELGEETGQQTGWYRTGSLSIATSPARLTHIRRQAALARAYDVAVEELGAGELDSLWPLLNTDDVIGAVFSPDDGRVNPSDLCAALVKGASSRGARIFEHAAVTGFVKAGDRVVGVRVGEHEIRAEQVVLCGGLWSRELAGLAGAEVPLLPCEHFYLLTRPIEGVSAQLPTLSDHDSHLYIRDDVGGLLVGCFEPQGKPLDPAALGEDFAFSLLDEDWDHFEPMMLNAMHRIPALETAEVRTLLNGPESFTPDGSFLLGPCAVPGLYLGCGMNSVGVATGGGAGWALATWLVDGKAPFHLGEVDPSRFHSVENRLEALMARAPEVLGRHYEIAWPGRVWHSARGLRHTPLHERWCDAGARFTQMYGWERPQYFASPGEPVLSFDRPAWFDQVGEEVRAAHQRAAVFDQSTFGKLRVTGADAEAFLDRVCANDMRRAPGRVIYTAMLDPGGGFQSDFTAQRLAVDEYLLYVGSGAVARDLTWLSAQRHDGERVVIEDVTAEIAVLGLMGPDAVRIAQTLCDGDLLALGYFGHTRCRFADIEVTAARLSYVGEFGWELSCRWQDAVALYDALHSAGARPAGLFAQTAMRIEKGYLAMGHDLDSDVSPVEAGLEFAVCEERDFIGRDALIERRRQPDAKRMASLVIDPGDAIPLGDEPVYRKDRLVGQLTSAAYGYRVGKYVALGYLDADLFAASDQVAVQLDIAGERVAGTAGLAAPYDPEGTRLKPSA